jgi:hypothetical protein
MRNKDPGRTKEDVMGKWKIIPLLALLLAASPARAGEFRLGLGAFVLAGGADVSVSYRPDRSHWQFGYKYARWTDEFDDPFTGHLLTRDTTTMTGPVVCYLIDIDAEETWYLGFSWLRCSLAETASLTGEKDRDDAQALCLGGGYTGRLGKSFYYDLGLFFSGASLHTATSVSETENAVMDLVLQLGMSL